MAVQLQGVTTQLSGGVSLKSNTPAMPWGGESLLGMGVSLTPTSISTGGGSTGVNFGAAAQAFFTRSGLSSGSSQGAAYGVMIDGLVTDGVLSNSGRRYP